MKSVVQGVKPVLESLDIGVVSFFSPRPNCCILQTINDTAIQYLGLKGTSFKSEQVLSLLHLHPSRFFAGCREQEVGGSSFQIETDKGRMLHLTVYQIPEEQQVVVLIAPAFPYREAAYPAEERTHDLLFVLDEEYRIKKIFANLMEQHLRLPVNMILGKIITDFFDESTAQKIRITLERANVTKSKQSLFYHSPLESDERSFKATIHWIMQGQRPVCYFAVDDVSATVDFSVLPRSESSNGILVTNEDGIIEFADSVCTRIFALEKDVLEGSDVHSLFSVETEDPSCKVCYQSPQGRNKDLRIRIAPFSGNTKQAHYIFRISDQSKTNANDTTVFVNLLLNLTFQLLQTPVETSDEVLLHILQELGEFSKSDRTYIFLCSPEDSTISNTHEWCAPGVSRQKNVLQNIPYNRFPQWMDTLHHG
ncbi:MAG: PAS domain-containing protein, partial [Sphaerochaetaceae bacterium]